MNANSKLGYTGATADTITAGYLLGNGYRAYIPALMRFSAPDDWSPFSLAAGLNPYAYCGGDPINRSDPSGHVSASTVLQEAESDASIAAREASTSVAADAAGPAGRKRPMPAPAAEPGEASGEPPAKTLRQQLEEGRAARRRRPANVPGLLGHQRQLQQDLDARFVTNLGSYLYLDPEQAERDRVVRHLYYVMEGGMSDADAAVLVAPHNLDKGLASYIEAKYVQTHTHLRSEARMMPLRHGAALGVALTRVKMNHSMKFPHWPDVSAQTTQRLIREEVEARVGSTVRLLDTPFFHAEGAE